MPGISIPLKVFVNDLATSSIGKIISKVQAMNEKVARPMKMQVDASQADGALSGIMGLVGKLGLAAAFASGAKAIVGLGADMEATRLRYEVFTGSAQRAGQAIDIVSKLATKTPFAKTELLEYGQQLLGAGLGADQMGRKLMVLGNISSATGKNLGELTSLYVKNKGNGLIQGEDLNQLADAKIPLQDFASMLGTNVQGLRKMGEQGKLTFSNLDTYFEKLGGTQGKWGKLNERMSNTLIGKWSNLKDTVEQMMSSAGEGQVPILGQLLDGGNAVLTFVQKNTEKIQQMFKPIVLAVQPLVDTFSRLMEQQYGNADAGSILATVFNRVGQVIQLVSPFVKVAATLLGTVWEQGQRVVNTLSKFWETSPRLQKFFSGLYTGALAAFKGVAEAVGKYLGGAATFIEGVFTGDFHKMGDGLKSTLAAVLDTQDVGRKSAAGFMKGWHEGLPTSNVFDVKAKVKGAAGTDAASSFLNGGKSGGAKPGSMTAAASAGTVTGGASGGSKVTNITLRTGDILKGLTINAGSTAEAPKELAQRLREVILAELNDVNTLASAN